MSRPAVLITRVIPDPVLSGLASVCDVDLYVGANTIPKEELKARLAGKQALMCLLTDRIDGEVLDAAPGLRIVANIAVGFDNIDRAAARDRGIVVTNTPDVLTEATADLTWGLLLAVMRRISEGERLVRSGEWKGWALDFLLGSDLRHKQLGLVGFGRIGRAVAARAPVFGMRVVYATLDADAPGSESEGAGCTRLTFDEVLATADVISLHVPLTPETRHLINRQTLARMKRGARLINTSRGPVVDEDALVWALRSGVIGGAALDVYECEPVVHPALLALENVVLAPHIGSATVETRTAMADLAARNVLAVLSGHAPLTPVPLA
ncbi:MAG: D-glycerate dehydrogenase [Acidobacteria bacterium]|nr:D-glycerate dehydrogenase [Acidobacteriota bacterium]